MEKKFSQGDWVVDCDFITVMINGVDTVICDFDPENVYPTVDQHSTVESDANKKLIAAAPDLLTRLHNLVLSVKAHPDYVNGEKGDEWHDIVELSEQTIKKAIE